MTEEQCVLDSMAESGSLPRSLLYACFLCLLLALIAVNLITLDSITTFVVC
ncbi:hypothetical protein T4B_1328 [Trichinella pseudospiralis]|uniref:Uncharacterized protein n=1 Tax=Trichinella pseudospiralis TaxID=6337 RepID=A0A0V1GBY6_TRIPS|nr:hypothetical protein T4B_1328 [Trichinella pseudospiralis]